MKSNSPKSIRILLADDHSLIRHGFATLLRYQEDFDVVGEASNGEEAVDLARRLSPDIVVMDLSMPSMTGVEATRQIRQNLPGVRVLILTTYGTSVEISRAVKFGASGALVKDTDDQMLLNALRKIAAGEVVFSPEIAAQMESDPLPPELTPRQQEVLGLLAQGLSSDGIGIRLGISTDAVNQHIDVIRRKFGAANRTEAVAIALRKQFIKA